MNSRRNWTEQEQKMLAELQIGDFQNSWNLIAKELNEKFKNKNRTGKQCRERYINYIQVKAGSRPHLKWEHTETHLFYRLYREHGAKWTIISRSIEGKSQNSLKNLFYGSLRKTTRMINKIDKDFGIKRAKPIKYESLLRIVSSNEKICWPSKLTEAYEKLKLNLLALMQNINEEPNVEEVLELICSVHRFNTELKRNCNSKKAHVNYESHDNEAMNDSLEEVEMGSKRNSAAETLSSSTYSTANLPAGNKSQQIEQDFSKVFDNLKKMQSVSLIEHENEILDGEGDSCSLIICSDGKFNSFSNIDLNYDLCNILNKPYSSDCFEFTF